MLAERAAVSCDVAATAGFTGFAATVPAVLQDTGIGQLLGSWGAHLSSRASSSAEEAAGPCGEGVGSGAAHTCACTACPAAAVCLLLLCYRKTACPGLRGQRHEGM